MICHNCFFFNFEFKSRHSVYNSNDLTTLSANTSNIANIAVKNVDYRSIIHNISKSGAIDLLKSAVLENCGYI